MSERERELQPGCTQPPNRNMEDALVEYAVNAASELEEMIDLFRLAQNAYKRSAEAGQSGDRKEMDRLRGIGTGHLFHAEKLWGGKSDPY